MSNADRDGPEFAGMMFHFEQPAEPVAPYSYIYEWDAIACKHQSLSANSWNGRYADRTIPVYRNPDPRIAELERDLAAAQAEVERERMRLIACGVVALADTPDSAKSAREMLPEYRSASLSDVERRVDECIALRAEAAALRADAEKWRELWKLLQAPNIKPIVDDFKAMLDSNLERLAAIDQARGGGNG